MSTVLSNPVRREPAGPQVITPHDLSEAFFRPRRFPYEPAEAALLARARRLDFLHEGERLALWTWGHGGPHVLLVHGWESRASHWGPWIVPLLEAGLRVTAVDNLAHGQSTGDRAHAVAWGRALVPIGRELGPLHAVIGHSAGSAALLHAFAHGLQPEASVHLAGPVSFRGVVQRFASAHGLDEALWPAFWQRADEALDGRSGEMELAALQHGLRHPALIIHDRQDKEVPFSESLSLHGAWPLSELRLTEGLGHRRLLRDPGVIAQTLAALRVPV